MGYTDSFNRANADTRKALEFPEEVVEGIIQDTIATSVALRVGDVRRMGAFQERLIVENSKPYTYWVNGTTAAGDNPLGSSNNDDTNQAAKDIGMRQLTTMQYDNLTLRTDEIAVMVSLPENWRQDSRASFELIRPKVLEAFAKKIDRAVFFGESGGADPIPSTFGNGLVPDAIAEGHVTYLADHLASSPTDGTRADRADAYAEVAQGLNVRGYDVSNFVVAPGERWNLRRQRDENGALLNADGLFGISVEEVSNGTWDPASAIALAGEYSNLVIGVRQGIEFALSDSATIFAPDGTPLLSAFQQKTTLLRATMRIGYVVTNPLKNLTGQREYPFAVLAPGSAPS